MVWKKGNRYINSRFMLSTVIVSPGLYVCLICLYFPFGTCQHFVCNKHPVAFNAKIHTEKEQERQELPCLLSR